MAAATSEGALGAAISWRSGCAWWCRDRGRRTTRRRASTAFGWGSRSSWWRCPSGHEGHSAVELSIVHAVYPPPAAISWLVTTLLDRLGRVSVRAGHRRAARAAHDCGPVDRGGRRADLGCADLARRCSGACGRAAAAQRPFRGKHGYPVTQIAVAVAVAATALPYLSRPVHRLVWFGVAVAVLTAVSGGHALPVNAVSSMALGWGVAAALHLAVGSPLGLPSAAEVTEWIADLRVAVADIIRAPSQEWGVEQFTGRDPAGKAIELSVYGRDASDAWPAGGSARTC